MLRHRHRTTLAATLAAAVALGVGSGGALAASNARDQGTSESKRTADSFGDRVSGGDAGVLVMATLGLTAAGFAVRRLSRDGDERRLG